MKRLIPIALIALLLPGIVLAKKVDKSPLFTDKIIELKRDFTVTGTTVSDGQVTISLAQKILDDPKKVESLKILQDQKFQQHLITRIGNNLAGSNMLRSMKINIVVTDLSYKNRKHLSSDRVPKGESLNLASQITLSENGAEEKTFEFTSKDHTSIDGEGESRFNVFGDILASRINWQAGDQHKQPKQK